MMNRGFLYILFATFFFSSMEVALKMVANDFNPLELNFLRFLIGTLLLWPLAIKSMRATRTRFERSHIPFFLLSGFLCVVVSMTFFQLAIVYAHASVVAILFSCNVIFVIPLAHIFLKERMTILHIGSLILSVIGMIFIINPEHMPNVTGITLSLLAAFTFALYGIIGQLGRQQYGYSGLALTFFSFVTGCIEMFILMLLSHIPSIAVILNVHGLPEFANIPFVKGISWGSVPALIYLGIFVTGLGYSFYFLAMETTSAAKASIIFFIKPALAPILAMLLLGDVIGENTIFGIVFILIGSSFPFIMRWLRGYHVLHMRHQRHRERQLQHQ